MKSDDESARVPRTATRRGVWVAWILAAVVAGAVLGANVFAVLGYLLSSPGQRPASWPGWNLLFYGLVFGVPLLLAGLTLWLGHKGRLPGLRR